MAKDLRKHTLFLREGDFEYLRSIYEPRGVPTSVIVRKIISATVDNLRKKEGPLPDLKDITYE